MTLATSAAWQAAVVAPQRVIDHRVEAVSLSGQSLGTVPVDGVRVSYDGDQAVCWRADFALSDPSLVPMSAASWLDGRSSTRLRVWWRLWTGSVWEEVPLGTFAVEDPKVDDRGLVSITVPGRDPLEVLRRAGYASAINVGGLTVSDGLALLFATIAPGWPVSIEPTTERLPAGLALWDGDVAEDWTRMAETAGMQVRTDRWGIITVARRPDPVVVLADWQEGPACPVTDLTAQFKTSEIPRQVVVESSAPDVTQVVGTWANPDADAFSLTKVLRIQSPTATTVAAATSLARLTGERLSDPMQSVEVEVPQRGDLDYQDLVLLRRAQSAVSGTFRVAGWGMTLAGRDRPPAPMRVRMMPRRWA